MISFPELAPLLQGQPRGCTRTTSLARKWTFKLFNCEKLLGIGLLPELFWRSSLRLEVDVVKSGATKGNRSSPTYWLRRSYNFGKPKISLKYSTRTAAATFHSLLYSNLPLETSGSEWPKWTASKACLTKPVSNYIYFLNTLNISRDFW